MTKIDEVTTEIGEGYLMEDWVFEMRLPFDELRSGQT